MTEIDINETTPSPDWTYWFSFDHSVLINRAKPFQIWSGGWLEPIDVSVGDKEPLLTDGMYWRQRRKDAHLSTLNATYFEKKRRERLQARGREKQ